MQLDSINFCIFIMINSITPGPNNLMLLQGAIKKGFLGCSQHMFGIMFGCASMTYVSYLGIGQLIALNPYALNIVKVLGSAYLIWLTWCIARSDLVPSADKIEHNKKKVGWDLPLNFWQAALFQLVNPKAWVMSATAPSIAIIVGANIFTDNIVFSVYHFVIGLACISVWAAGGAALQSLLHKKRLMFAIHKVVVLGLLYCIVSIWL